MLEDFNINLESKQKGEEAEKRFKDWLDKHNIPYFYIKQDINNFSSALNNSFSGKRPDFMILVPNFGFIFVDVKNRRLHPGYKNYPLDSSETKKYSSIQRKFNMNIWYVISNEDYDYKTWLWIPISKVLESGMPKFISSKSKEDFYAVPLEEFIQIADNDSLDRLFSGSFSTDKFFS
jgi:predicted HTH transcriptional regulator